MSIFNARRFFLLTICVSVFSLSLLFAQLYKNELPLSYAALCIYVISILAFVILCWLLTKKLFVSTHPVHDSSPISSDDLYSFTHDPATNLPTAQQAVKVFDQALKTPKRLAAITFKPVNFQHVNSLLGHHNSDLLLLQLAYCLQKTVESNTQLLNFSLDSAPIRIARLQSLNFLVIFDLSDVNHDDEIAINDVCKQLANGVPDAMSFKSFSLNFELAFGIAISDDSGNNVSEIISYAEDALLSSLSSQNGINFFDKKTVLNTQKQLARMEKLSEDIVDEKLSWYLQPQINVNDNSIIGFQLNVHWYENDKEPLELTDFSNLAEHSGEVYLLTKQMLKQAFETLVLLHRRGLYLSVSVTMTSKDLFEADLVDFIEQQISQYGMSGRYLMIELTEAVILSAGQRAKETIDQLKSLDITIAIADFSGSYESLRYIRKMAIHQVKVNCQQLTNDSKNRVDKAITNALITLTRSMKIPLIGTHIDKDDAAKAYVSMGGIYIQGDIISPGVVPEELDIWLDKWLIQLSKTKRTYL